MTEKASQDIKQVVEQAYIRGIHGEQNRALIDEGFHPAFEILVLDENKVKKVSVDE